MYVCIYVCMYMIECIYVCKYVAVRYVCMYTCNHRLFTLDIKCASNSCTSRPDVCQSLVAIKHPWIACQKTSIWLTHVACESKLHLVLSTSVHSCLDNGGNQACGRVYAPAAHAFSARIEYQHYILVDQFAYIQIQLISIWPCYKLLTVNSCILICRMYMYSDKFFPAVFNMKPKKWKYVI